MSASEPSSSCEPPARSVLDDATRHPPEALLDRLDGVGRREERRDVRLGQVQRHRAKSMNAERGS